MKKLTMILAAVVVACLAAPLVAEAIGPDIDGRTPVSVYGVKPDGSRAQFRMTDAGEALVSGTVTVQGTTPDGGTVAQRFDGDGRAVVAVGAMPGPSIGADLTTTAAAGPTIPAGAEYLVCAMTDLWLRFDGQTATADVPSIPFFARTCRLVGPFSSSTATSGILPAGATALAGKEIVAIPMTRPQ